MKYPQFIENETFFRLDKSHSEMDQLIGMTENLKKIHLLGNKNYNTFEDLIASYLRSGIEIFQLETGIVSQITENKDYIVKDVVSPLKAIKSGDIYELDGTYCREVYKTRTVIGLPHVGMIDEMKTHPVYQNLKLEAYISAPIYVRDKIYGTLNFTSQNPRDHGFSEHEHDLISLMANSIGNFILLQEKEQSLVRLNDRLKELVGYVAHDLRNPLGVMSNLAKIIMKLDLDEDEKQKIVGRIRINADRCLELVNTILEVAALGSGKIVANIKPFALKAMLDDSLENYDVLAKERKISIKVDVPEHLFIAGDEARLLQVCNNLIGNAIKYSGKESEVEIVCLGKEGDCTPLQISNSISTNEKEQESLDSSVYKSIGFGLDIVREILDIHNSTLEVEEKDGWFKVKIYLPLVTNQA